MKDRIKILRKLIGQKEFDSLVASGMFLAKELEFLEQNTRGDNSPTSQQLEVFYLAEYAHIQNYRNDAKQQIQNLADGITESNAKTLLDKIDETINGKHPNWKTIGLNVASAVIWDVILILIGLMAIIKSDVVFTIFVAFGRWIVQLHGI